MSILGNNDIKRKSYINDFFHYSDEHFLDVWESCVSILKNSLPLSAISQKPEQLFFIGQPGWEGKLKDLTSLDEDQLIPLLRTDNYYIETPPLLHPAFAKTIADILKISENDLNGLMNYELALIDNIIEKRRIHDDVIHSGPYYVKTLLDSKAMIVRGQFVIKPSDLLITKIPLLPLESRIFYTDLFDLGYPGVANLSYQLITILSGKVSINEDKPGLSSIQSYRFINKCLTELIVAVEYKLENNKWAVLEKIQNLSSSNNANQVSDTENIQEALFESHFVPQYRQNDIEQDSNSPIDLIYISDSEICIQFPKSIVFYDLTYKKENIRIEVKKYKIHQINTKENIIQFFGFQDGDKLQLSDFFHYNYALKKWFFGRVNGFNYVELTHHAESQNLINYSADTEIFLVELAGYPVMKVHSTCGKYFWIEDKFGNGGLYSVMTGLFVKSSTELYTALKEEIPVLEVVEFAERKSFDAQVQMKLKEEQERNKFEMGAIVVFKQEWTVLKNDILFHNGKPIFKISYPYSSATFSKDGSILFLASLLGIVVIDVYKYLNDFKMEYRFIETV